MGARFLAGLVAMIMAFAALAAPARAADDDDIEYLKFRFAERGGQLVVKDLGLGSLLFDQSAYAKLRENPLVTSIAVRLYVYRKGRDQAVTYRLISVHIVYDLWLETYEVRVDGPRGRESGSFARLDQAYKAITELRDIPIANLRDIAVGPHHYLAMQVELNPVSEETLAEVRRWLSRPAGTTSLDRGTSFFGSFVSIFVNAKPPEADRVVRVQSQPFYRVSRSQAGKSP
jgi:hypothetical protein